MKKIIGLLTLTGLLAVAAQAAETAKVEKATFKLKGADCAESCAAADKQLASIQGISLKTCAESHKTTISYNPEKMNAKQLIAAIKKAGLEIDSQFVSLKVNDMACGACENKVNGALTKLKGVKKTEVSSETKEAIVSFNPELLTEKQIMAAVKSTGFTPTKPVEQTELN